MKIDFIVQGIEQLNYRTAEFYYPEKNISITRNYNYFSANITYSSPKSSILIKIENITIPNSDPFTYEHKFLVIYPIIRNPEQLVKDSL